MAGGLQFSDLLVSVDDVASPFSGRSASGARPRDPEEGPDPIEWGAVVVSQARDGVERKRPRKKHHTPKATATVGGVDYSFGGWGAYEAERRHAERDMRNQAAYVHGGGRGPFYAGSTYYPGRSTVGGRDAAESLLAAHPPGALTKAAAHLSKALGNLEDTLCDPDEDGLWACAPPATLLETERAPHPFPAITVPPLTSDDVDAFIADEDYASPDDLYMMANDAIATAATLRVVIAPPPALENRAVPALPARQVSLADDEAVVKLESAVIPYVTRVEELQSAVAGILDKTASAIDAALAKRRA